MVAEALRAASFAVDEAQDAAAAIARLAEETYDAVVLDWMLPDLSGVELCRELRRDGFEAPVLILTAKGDVADRVAGLDAGADDYLRKPFAVAELVARLRALTRRRTPALLPIQRVGRAEIDLASRRAVLDGREVPLTAREFALLECLLAHRGRAVSRAEILRAAWDTENPGASASLEVLVSRLRRKLGAGGAPCPIVTHRGYGYAISDEP